MEGILLDSSNVELHYWISRCQLEQGMTRDTFEIFKYANQINPDHENCKRYLEITIKELKK